MYLISCDPDTKHIAFAIFKKGKFETTKKIKTNLLDTIEVFDKYKPFILAIETQYSRFNVKTLIQLVEVRAMVETIARMMPEAQGIYRVPASTWQKEILQIPPKTKRAERKRISRESASDFIGKELKDNDIADAINIGRYVLNNFRKLELLEV